jgi:hypothetical protein
VTVVLAVIKLLQRIIMMELLGWVLEQDNNYANIITLESNEEDI